MNLLQSIRQRVAGTRLETALRASGLGPWVLGVYERRVAARGIQGVTAFGERMRFRARTKNAITRIDMHGRNERSLLEEILRVLRRGDVFYDVGANLGTISVLVGLKLHRLGGGTVVAFEPNPTTAAETAANSQLNGLDVRVMVLALGAEEGEATLVIDGDCAKGTDSLMLAAIPGQTTLTVPVRSGDVVAQELGLAPTVMKIDVEGAELTVLRGLSGALTDSPLREIFVEIHPQLLAAAGADEASVIDYMRGHGFVSRWSQARGTEVHHRFVRLVPGQGGAPLPPPKVRREG